MPRQSRAGPKAWLELFSRGSKSAGHSDRFLVGEQPSRPPRSGLEPGQTGRRQPASCLTPRRVHQLPPCLWARGATTTRQGMPIRSATLEFHPRPARGHGHQAAPSNPRGRQHGGIELLARASLAPPSLGIGDHNIQLEGGDGQWPADALKRQWCCSNRRLGPLPDTPMPTTITSGSSDASRRESEPSRASEYLTAELKDMGPPRYRAAGHQPFAPGVRAWQRSRGLGRTPDKPSSAKAFGHPKPATNWWLPSWLLPQTNAPEGTCQAESASRSKAWVPNRGQRREPIAELGARRNTKGRGASSGPPPGRPCQGLEINQGGLP